MPNPWIMQWLTYCLRRLASLRHGDERCLVVWEMLRELQRMANQRLDYPRKSWG